MFLGSVVTNSVSFFFFSSRRRHTRCYRDWSSDVCSSDLGRPRSGDSRTGTSAWAAIRCCWWRGRPRSEERRVGKECRSRLSPDHEKKKSEEKAMAYDNEQSHAKKLAIQAKNEID